MESVELDTARRVEIVKSNIAEAAYKAGRDASEVRLVAVTKFVEPERIQPAFAAGVAEVGENRAQELVDKYDFFKANGQRVHFIGQLQLNKVKYLVGRAELIQSADRMEAFAEIDRIAVNRGVRQDTLVEVNIGAEPQKAGIAPEGLTELFKRISDMPGICVRGLMCIPPAAEGDKVRGYFRRMKELFDEYKGLDIPFICMDILSMGMSGDYAAAVEEGATMVRVGSAIFGARQRH